MIPFGCPQCNESIELPDDWDFTVVSCRHCGMTTNLMAASDAAELSAGDLLGHFELIKLLGSGGNGTVWKAHDRQLDRDVAIKFPSRDLIEQKDRVRFLREASLAARVKHPHIVPIHHVGESELQRFSADGTCEKLPSRLHIISELVDGAGLDRYIRAGKRPTPAKAARIIEQIADALGAAHQATVIHRDVKPSNIMLDRKGRPFLLDFGVSKSTDTGNRTVSLEGAIIGSPGYLSPEQARGENSTLDVRSDIYSLGVVLFELLTFRLPFVGTEKEIEHATADPTRDAPSPRQFVPELPRDLETICLKCLEKNRELRFANGRELAAELRRYREGLPILSRPISGAERFARWCRRKPLVAGLSASVLLTLLIGIWVALTLDRSRTELKSQVASKEKEIEGKDKEIDNKDKEIETKSEQLEVTEADRQKQTEIAKSKAAEAKAAEEQKAWLAYVADMQEIERVWPENKSETVKQLLARHEPMAEKDNHDFRGFEWHYWQRRLSERESEMLQLPEFCRSLAFSPDGKTLAATNRTHMRVWNVATRKEIGTWRISVGKDSQKGKGGDDYPWSDYRWATDTSVAFSPDGKMVAATCTITNAKREPFGSLRIWKIEDGRELFAIDGDAEISGRSTCFSPDGKYIVAGGYLSRNSYEGDLPFKCWLISSRQSTLPEGVGDRERELVKYATKTTGKPHNRDDAARHLSFTGGVLSLASKGIAGQGGQTNEYSWPSLRRLSQIDVPWIASRELSLFRVRVSPEGVVLARPSRERRGDLELNLQIQQVDDKAICVAVRNREFAVGRKDGKVRVWDNDEGIQKFTREFQAHVGEVRCVAMGPAGMIASSATNNDGTTSIRLLAGGTRDQLGDALDVPERLVRPDRLWPVKSFDGRTQVEPVLNTGLRIRDLDRPNENWEIPFPLKSADKIRVQFTPRDTFILVMGIDKQRELTIWNRQEKRMTASFGNIQPVYGISYHADETLVAFGDGRSLLIVDPRDGKLLHKLPVGGATFSPSGKLRVSVTGFGKLSAAVFDVTTGTEVRRFDLMGLRHGAIHAVDHQDKQLFVACDGLLRVCDLEAGTVTEAVLQEGSSTSSIAVSHDRRRLFHRIGSNTVDVVCAKSFSRMLRITLNKELRRFEDLEPFFESLLTQWRKSQ